MFHSLSLSAIQSLYSVIRSQRCIRFSRTSNPAISLSAMHSLYSVIRSHQYIRSERQRSIRLCLESASDIATVTCSPHRLQLPPARSAAARCSHLEMAAAAQMQYRCWCPFGDVCSKKGGTLAIKKTMEDAKYAILNHLSQSPKHHMEWEAANEVDLDPWITAEECEVDATSRTESPPHCAQPETPPKDPRHSAPQARPPMSSQAMAGPPPDFQQKAIVK